MSRADSSSIWARAGRPGPGLRLRRRFLRALHRLVLRLRGQRRGFRHRGLGGSAEGSRGLELRGVRLRLRAAGRRLGRFPPKVRLGVRALGGKLVELGVGPVARVMVVWVKVGVKKAKVMASA